MQIDPIIKLDDYWPYQVSVLADLIAKHTTSVLKAHGDLNLSQWRVLAAVAELPGRTAAEVVTVTPMDKGIVSRATATLVADGILEKIGDADDKRRSRLYVTNSGAKSYQAIRKALTSQTAGVQTKTSLNTDLLLAIKKMKQLNI
ncbi:MAG: MarR family transcriptional regulator [Hellea sp.]|nr:MarR family transcriptional regulator [Hellea sp.]